MPLARDLFLLLGNEHRCADRIADLATIEVLLAPVVAHKGCKRGVLAISDGRFAVEVFKEDRPDLGATGAIEGRQAEGDVHTGLEGLVKGSNAVCCEEEDAVEVLEGAKEDCANYEDTAVDD